MLRCDTNFMNNLLKSAPSSYELRKLRMIADYQICKSAGKVLFPQEEIAVTHSKKTRRIRHIYLNNQLIATLRPKDGVFALTPFGGALLLNGIPFINLPIIVAQNQIASYIREGRSLFCKHVVSISSEIRAGDEPARYVGDRHRGHGTGWGTGLSPRPERAQSVSCQHDDRVFGASGPTLDHPRVRYGRQTCQNASRSQR